MPPVTRNLLIANGVMFVLLLGTGGVLGTLALWPLGGGFMPWQLVTYAFLHASAGHILFNMLGVYSFGADLERVWGPRRFLTYYIACAVAAGVTQLVFAAVTGAVYPTVGASGAVFGLLLAFALLFPHRTVMLLFPPIPMKAPVFALVFGALELLLGVTGTQEGVAHFAHLGGMLGGYLLLLSWRGSSRSQRR
jgi:membrane associated rhomboid family serine protease